MLSIFPSLLSFEPLAPFVLRVLLGIILVYWSYGRIKNHASWQKASLGFIEGIVGILLIAGFLTQLAALVAAIIFLVKVIRKIMAMAFLTDGVNYYFILLIISLSLLISGPGALSFDLPL